jgi:isochorismate hydrolase
MSEQMSDLIEIVKCMQKQQHILTKMLIHLGCRADLYDNFICECFKELENVEIPNFKEAK